MTDRILIVSISIIVFLLLIVGLFFYLLLKAHKEWKTKVKNVPADRMFKTKQDFIQFYIKKGYSEKSIDYIYEKTKKFLKAKELVLLPQDNLITLYERQEDEWFYIIDKWFLELGRQKPEIEKLKSLMTKYKEINFEYLIELIDN